MRLQAGIQGYLAHKKTPTPHKITPTVRFLMSEVPLCPPRAGKATLRVGGEGGVRSRARGVVPTGDTEWGSTYRRHRVG